MRRRYLLTFPLVLLPFLLSGCSVAGIDLSFNTAATTGAGTSATAVPAVSTAVIVPTPAFDLQAGNCPDAANQAIALMTSVQNLSVNLDMSLALRPVKVLCGQKGAALASYRTQVTSAELSAFVIDGTWSALFTASRITLLNTLIRHLHALYPAAICKVLVYENNVLVGSIVLGTDNRPQVNCCSG